jgi:nitroreductase
MLKFLKEKIYTRKSVRKYKPIKVDEHTLEKILEFCKNIKPLFPDIKVKTEITEKQNIRCILPWKTEQVITIFSQNKTGYLENVGFMFQQVDLYLQSIGLGSCWLGMGSLKKYTQDGEYEFVIMLAFGIPDEPITRESVLEFKRKSLEDISDRIDLRLECARLAPSAINSQPWYFVHEGEIIHAYQKENMFKRLILSKKNQIDMGIALAHIYLENENTFEFFKVENPKEIKGAKYTGSFKI